MNGHEFQYLEFNLLKDSEFFHVRMSSQALRSRGRDGFEYIAFVNKTDPDSSQTYKIGISGTAASGVKILGGNIIAARSLFKMLGTNGEAIEITSENWRLLLEGNGASNKQVRLAVLDYVNNRTDEKPSVPITLLEILAAIIYPPDRIISALNNFMTNGLIGRRDLPDFNRLKEMDDYSEVLTHLIAAINLFTNNELQRLEIANRYREELKRDPEHSSQEPKKSKLDKVKIFLSYSTRNKKLASVLKEELEKYGLDVFLAHQTIRVSHEWEKRILTELNDCHVFVALLTKESRKSEWTDQEAGFAMAYGKKIIPLLRSQKVPHGFLNRFQADKIKIKNIRLNCREIISGFIENEGLHQAFRNAIIVKLGQSKGFIETNEYIDRILEFPGFSSSQLDSIDALIKENDQIHNAFNTDKVLKPFLMREREKLNRAS